MATTDNYDQFFAGSDFKASTVNHEQGLEESFFLGLRLNRGVDLEQLGEEFGADLGKYDAVIQDLLKQELVAKSGRRLRLTARGRLLSNEVFQRFLSEPLTFENHLVT